MLRLCYVERFTAPNRICRIFPRLRIVGPSLAKSSGFSRHFFSHRRYVRVVGWSFLGSSVDGSFWLGSNSFSGREEAASGNGERAHYGKGENFFHADNTGQTLIVRLHAEVSEERYQKILQ